MRQDYQEIFFEVKDRVVVLMGELASEDDLVAKFFLPNDWSLVLECERYYSPAYSISISHKIYGSFVVWMLMNVFEELGDKKYGSPTIENKINFLFDESGLIFKNSIFYKEKYDEMNSMSYE